MSSLRNDALLIWNAGVDAVRAQQLIAAQVRLESDQLSIADHLFSLTDFDRLIIVGAGKAASGMATGLTAVIGDRLPIEGWINVPEDTVPREGAEVLRHLHVHPARPAGVNEPTAAGVEGTEQILRLVRQARPRDLCIALISGGGSALLPAPIPGITLGDKLAVTRYLSESGADITELNTVRKHLSEVKGGGLLRACRAGQLITLILSDVLGDPLDLIASGPTVPDSSQNTDALAILNRFDPQRRLPSSIYDALNSAPVTPPPPTTTATTCVLGNNALAVDEAGIVAERLGYNHIMHSAAASEPSAEQVGREFAEMLLTMLRSPDPHRSNCLITGGEPVVTLAPAAIRGHGGRNQQLVLAAYQHLLGCNLTQHEWNQIALLSAGTDGEDGPTDAAGAVLDASVHRVASEKQLDVADYLHRNDAYHFFQQTGGLIQSGPTGTNVCDLRVGVVKKRR
ncbi:MAG: glycerate kinase [Novipirellula sp. JB048]